MVKKKRKNSRPKSMIALIIVLILIVWQWHEIESKAEADYTPASQTGSSEWLPVADELQTVAMPKDVKSIMLDYPGFVVSFNPEHHIPNYVAWTLTADEVDIQEVKKRTDNFAPDPNVKGCPSLNDYRRSGYDRGHMAPAGDMKWNIDAMNACFLLTNMAPQAHTLNQGAWRTLEEKCREWARRDSAIVIVCGPILTDKITKSIGDTKVSVPKRFFKVVLSPNLNPPQAIGFIMNNGQVKGGMQEAAVSVDSVESVTGFDFFSALPDDIERRIEAECNFPRMSRKKI